MGQNWRVHIDQIVQTDPNWSNMVQHQPKTCPKGVQHNQFPWSSFFYCLYKLLIVTKQDKKQFLYTSHPWQLYQTKTKEPSVICSIIWHFISINNENHYYTKNIIVTIAVMGLLHVLFTFRIYIELVYLYIKILTLRRRKKQLLN